MARSALFTTDLFDGKLIAHSAQDFDYPAENASNDLPGVPFAAAEGDGGQFEVSSSNAWIDIDEGGGEVSVAIPYGGQLRSELVTRITAALNASALGWVYAVSFNASHKCVISATGGTFDILWDTGTHSANNIGAELGFSTASDDTGLNSYTASQRRYSTSTWLLYDMGVDTTVDAFMAFLDGNSATNYGAGSSSFKVYGNQTIVSTGSLDAWDDFADLSSLFSDRGVEDENKIQVVAQASPSAYRFYMIGWRHFDQSNEHRIGVSRAFNALWSSTRTLRELNGHGMVDRGTSLGQGNYYPVPGERVWEAPLAFDSWGVADYRAVVHAAVRHGRDRALMWAARWDDILDGTYDAGDEADKGLLLWAAIQDYSLDNLRAEGSEYVTGELLIEQVR